MSIVKSLILKQPEASKFILDLRNLVGLTQEQFASALGVTYNTVNRWERRRMQPSPLALKQLERLLRDQIESSSAHQRDRARELLTQYFSDRIQS